MHELQIDTMFLVGQDTEGVDVVLVGSTLRSEAKVGVDMEVLRIFEELSQGLRLVTLRFEELPKLKLASVDGNQPHAIGVDMAGRLKFGERDVNPGLTMDDDTHIGDP